MYAIIVTWTEFGATDQNTAHLFNDYYCMHNLKRKNKNISKVL